MRSVIWDWNGTLLDDLDLCISSINQLLRDRNLKELDHNYYKEIFSFPVKDYYAAIGFDFSKEDFSVPAHQFIDLYENGVRNCRLQAAAIQVLNALKARGKRQFILSAMQQEMLAQTLDQQRILEFFEGVAGLSDHYAVSKIERGHQLIHQFGINKADTVMIGDTIHDFEVAEKLGIACILIANGHQSEERLRTTGTRVIGNLNELLNSGWLD